VVPRGYARHRNDPRSPSVDIGRPKRIIEVEPVSLPLPDVVPDLEPATPEPAPVEPDRSRLAP
jgi:hypothetical protein